MMMVTQIDYLHIKQRQVKSELHVSKRGRKKEQEKWINSERQIIGEYMK